MLVIVHGVLSITGYKMHLAGCARCLVHLANDEFGMLVHTQPHSQCEQFGLV